MSLSLVNASSQKLTLAAPLTSAAPFCLGFWVALKTTSASYSFCSLGLSSADTYLNFWPDIGNSTVRSSHVTNGVGDWGANPAIGTGAWTANAWVYVLYREVTSSNHRSQTLTAATGLIATAATGTSGATAFDKITIGSKSSNTDTDSIDGSVPMNGYIAEFFYADADIMPGITSAFMGNEIFRHLAHRGPWALPWLHKNIVEYRSFRAPCVDSPTDKFGDVYQRGGIRSWTPTNGPILNGFHPPFLAADYVRPNQSFGIGIL